MVVGHRWPAQRREAARMGSPAQCQYLPVPPETEGHERPVLHRQNRSAEMSLGPCQARHRVRVGSEVVRVRVRR